MRSIHLVLTGLITLACSFTAMADYQGFVDLEETLSPNSSELAGVLGRVAIDPVINDCLPEFFGDSRAIASVRKITGAYYFQPDPSTVTTRSIYYVTGYSSDSSPAPVLQVRVENPGRSTERVDLCIVQK